MRCLLLLVVVLLAVSVNATFSVNEAYTQLMYSYAAYCPAANIESWNCWFCTYNSSETTHGFVLYEVVQDSGTNTLAYLGYVGTTVEVVFRGTQSSSLANWIEDLYAVESQAFPNAAGADVHSGFFAAYSAVKPTLATALNNLIAAIHATQVIFTGHSLGAALATLAAVDLAPKLHIPVSVYNFGSPRVGNSAFATYYNSIVPNTFRVTNKDDIVPHLPFEDMGFNHVAQEVWFSTSTHYQVCNESGEDSSCADSVIFLFWSTSDHTSYLQISLDVDSC